MLVFKNDNNLIYGIHDTISKEEALPYIENGALWFDELEINPPKINERERIEMYLNDDLTISYKIVQDKEDEFINEHEKITKEVHRTTLISSDDNLINMDILMTIDEKLNVIIEHLGLNA